MGSKGETNRQRIVAAADQLFYHKGYNQTSFSDIAEAASLSRGNFYYYFKAKDDILSAVIDQRSEAMRAMLRTWDRECATPRERLKRFVGLLSQREEHILRYGCPIGSLTAELAKNQFGLHGQARALFEVLRIWLEGQFTALGQVKRAQRLALHLLAMTQGASLVGNAYADGGFLREEAERLAAWIDSI